MPGVYWVKSGHRYFGRHYFQDGKMTEANVAESQSVLKALAEENVAPATSAVPHLLKSGDILDSEE